MDDEAGEPIGACLRRYREAAGLSLAGLARLVNYSRGYLSKVENGRVPGNRALAERCDAALGAGGVLAKLVDARPRTTGPPHRQTPVAVAASQPLPAGLAIGLAYVLALDSAHAQLREVALTDQSPDRVLAANRAVHDAGLYAVREQLLVAAPAAVVAAGESLFLRLIAVRDAVRTGARLDSAEYHLVYHPLAEALWRFRLALRACFDEDPFTPQTLDRADWSDRERCPGCGPGPDGAP